MQSSLLRAKLHRPASNAVAVSRTRLLKQLRAGLTCRVTLLSAAAGFGKSTLLSAWLDQLQAEQQPASKVKTGWLTLDSDDNSLPRFVRYVVAVIESIFPHTCTSVTGLMQDNLSASVEDLADAFSDCLRSLPDRFVLVFDDWHAIEDAATHTFVARLVQFAPPAFHLVISTRFDPLQLPLNRWRAQGWLTEVRQRDLCFTLDETAAFLQHSLAGATPTETVTALYGYTEGWPVGLQLAALALRGHPDQAAFLADMAANGNRFALDYLRDDVLAQQPEAVQAFLLSTAVLKRFCVGLCAAVLEIDEAEAQRLLNVVERANLFLVDLSTPAKWYRYHHQFQGMLLSKLSERQAPDKIAALHRRAAHWLSTHGELTEALDCLIRIGDLHAAADMLEAGRTERVNNGRAEELVDALACIPQHILNRRPLLLLSAAWVDGGRLDWASCSAKVERIERLLHEESVSDTHATPATIELELMALRCAMDHRLEGKVTLADIQAVWLRAQPDLAQIAHPVVGMLAEQCQFLGVIGLGLTMIDTALRHNADWPLAAQCDLLSRKATMLMWNCELDAAEPILQSITQMAQQHNLPLAALKSQLTLGVIAGVRHQLDACERYMLEVMADPFIDNAKCAMLAVSRLIEVYVYQGRLDQARHLVEQFQACARTINLRYLHEHAEAMTAYLALAAGDTGTAVAWVLRGLKQGPVHHPVDRLPIIRARILVAEGSAASLQAAILLLNVYIAYMERHHLRFYLVEGMSLHALALAGLGQTEQALAELSHAVQIAVPHGMVGRLIQRGQPMKQLLQALSTHPQHAAQTASAQLVLAAFGDAGETASLPPRAQSPQTLIEPLSDRESDVLRLMAEGLSNKAIAQQLIISPFTVRNHTVNIFGKLQVANRMQAVERARALGLLPIIKGQ